MPGWGKSEETVLGLYKRLLYSPLQPPPALNNLYILMHVCLMERSLPRPPPWKNEPFLFMSPPPPFKKVQGDNVAPVLPLDLISCMVSESAQ